MLWYLWAPEKREVLVVTPQENQVFIPASPVHAVIRVIVHAVQLQTSLKSLYLSHHHDNLTDRLIGKGRREGWMKQGRKMVENWFSLSSINHIDYRKGIISSMDLIPRIKWRQRRDWWGELILKDDDGNDQKSMPFGWHANVPEWNYLYKTLLNALLTFVLV